MIEVVCAVIEDGAGRVLACRRGSAMSMAGKWEFPGGKLEPGEPVREALARELREELGVELAVGEQWAAVEHDYGTLAIRLMPFRCRISRGQPQPHEHDELRWLTAEQTRHLDWAAADVPVADYWRGVVGRP